MLIVSFTTSLSAHKNIWCAIIFVLIIYTPYYTLSKKNNYANIPNNTVLRVVKKTNVTVDYDVENLGIDNFSSKKIEIFNTIFVKNDTRKKVEVINSREKENVVEKLKLFTKVKTVTRDFSQTYKNAISEALPKSKQIVDRFHIFKNLTDDLNDYIKRNVAERLKMIDRKKML